MFALNRSTERGRESMAVNYYGSPRWSGEIADCSMPMTFDTYSNCSFGCVYCFSQYQRAIGGAKSDYLGKQIKPINVEKVKRMFLEPDSSQFGAYIRARKVMQWGGLSDPFDFYEKQQGVGLEMLRFFRSIDYPICFSTKGVWWVKDERYSDLFKGNKNWNVKVSIITLNEAKAAAIERGVATPSERLDTINEIAGWGGGGATLRLRPFIIGVSNPNHVDLIAKAAEAGAGAVSTEFFCLERRSTHLKTKGLPVLDAACGFNVLEFYKRNSTGSGYLRLNRELKRPYVDEMEAACRETGLRFYVSDAHFKERCCNGSCCGLSPEWNYSRGQFTEALLLCKQKGSVRWADIAEEASFLKEFKWGKAEGFNSNSAERRAAFHYHSMFDYLRWLWNNPNSGQSPYKMFGGVISPSGTDDEGNLIYSLQSEKL